MRAVESQTRNCDVSAEPTFWEQIAQSAWGRYISRIEREAILNAHHLAGRPSRGLEIGCEGGRWSKLLSDLGWKMTCTEIDAQLLTICAKQVPTASCILVQPSDSQIPCESESVGLLLCVEVGAVIKSHWLPGEASRILIEDGLLVGVFFNFLSYRGLIAQCTASLRGSYEYYECSYPLWRKGLSRNGFRFLHEVGLCWFPFRRASNSVLIPVFTRIEHRIGLQRLPTISPWVVFVAQKCRR